MTRRDPMRALSIRQPWVELILRGRKTREFRSTPTQLRARVYLYASLHPADYPPAWRAVGAKPGELPTGSIVGTVEIVDGRWDGRSGNYAYILKSPRRFARPRRPRNQARPVFWIPKF